MARHTTVRMLPNSSDDSGEDSSTASAPEWRETASRSLWNSVNQVSVRGFRPQRLQKPFVARCHSVNNCWRGTNRQKRLLCMSSRCPVVSTPECCLRPKAMGEERLSLIWYASNVGFVVQDLHLHGLH